MAHRPISFAAAISFSLLAVILALAIASIWIHPWNHRLTITEGFHIGAWGRDWDVRLVLCNDLDYGPYCGSIIGIVDDEGNVQPPLEDEAHFGDMAGIYYRYFRWADATLWTLMVSLWYPASMSAVLPALWLLRSRRRDKDDPALTNGCS
ncbi:MAG: hypothetical protein ACOC7K_01925 [bacterium]